MIIKILLIVLVLALATWFLANRTKAHARAGVRIIVIIFSLIATVTILFPELANDVANVLGVGRGADLILYLLTTLFLFFVLSYYIRVHEDNKRIVVLARKIAILEANAEQDKKNHKPKSR